MSLSLSQSLADGGRSRSRRARLVGRAWGQIRPHLLMVLPIACAVGALAFAGVALNVGRANRTIAALETNHDVEVATTARPEVMLARIAFLLGHDRVDEIQPYVEALDKVASDSLRAIAHYNLANGRLRQAFDLITRDKLDPAGPYVVLSRQEYRRALTFAPDDWDAKFNLDVASRLIRDFPSFERTSGDEVRKDPKKIWTDIPGKPEGLP